KPENKEKKENEDAKEENKAEKDNKDENVEGNDSKYNEDNGSRACEKLVHFIVSKGSKQSEPIVLGLNSQIPVVQKALHIAVELAEAPFGRPRIICFSLKINKDGIYVPVAKIVEYSKICL
ncbi:21388_t:CDS:2, partial [Cetraspora pellucida]